MNSLKLLVTIVVILGYTTSGQVSLALQLDQDRPPANLGVIDDGALGWTWSGMEEYSDYSLYGGSGHAGGPGSNCAYTFHGTGVEVFGISGPSVTIDTKTHKLGSMRVILDGKVQGTYSERSPIVQYNYLITRISDLPEGYHVLQMEPAAGWCVVDCIRVTSSQVVSTTKPADAGQSNLSQHIAVPSSQPSNLFWKQVDSGAPTVGLTVLNPSNGPGKAYDALYARAVTSAHAHGIKVLGYVPNRAQADIAITETEIQDYFQWYQVDGVMFDSVSCQYSDLRYYYAKLYAFVKQMVPQSIIALNPGNYGSEALLAVGDIVVTYYGPYDRYQGDIGIPEWAANYPSSRFWHIIYGVGSISDLRSVVALSKYRHAGWVYVTSEELPNATDGLLDNAYWSSEVAAVRHE